MSNYKYDKVLIIGVGLIGSSIARALREHGISSEIHGLDSDSKVINKCKDLKILSSLQNKIEKFSFQFDLIIICTPLSTYNAIFTYLNNFINKPTLITDVGSTKMSVIEDYKKTYKKSD